MSDQDIQLDYGYLAQNALRQVIREALEVTQTLGDTPGGHHFYIEFLTTAEGVDISTELKTRYPDKMTVVLQHSFENLTVTNEQFSVTLKFGGTPEKLIIPFHAITSFQDPSVQFSLQFEIFTAPQTEKAQEEEANMADGADSADPSNASEKPISADIVSLDSFRKD